MDIWRDMQERLDALTAAGLRRDPPVVSSACGPRVRVGGREPICLCSNDYLSLSADPAVRSAAVEAVGRWGFGAGASRLVSGTSELHIELERSLADFKGCEASAVTSTGWMANHAAIHALAGSGDLILCDKLDHASIIDAARACGATLRTYAHRDVSRAEALLHRLRQRYRRCLIVTDSLFSMDGDVAPLAELVELKRRFDAQLLIDEAHATGVLGAHGRGAAELLGVEEHVDATVGTLSKALGSMGGFVAGPGVLIETIRNTARAFIYTTAPPPAACAAALTALRIVRDQPERRGRLLELAADLRDRLRADGMDTRDSQSQIIPVVIGDAGEAVRVSRALFDAGFFAAAIRPPTVPRGTSRLRVSLCSGHETADIERFADALRAAMA